MYNFFGVIVQLYKWALLFVFFYATAVFSSQQPLPTRGIAVLLINPATYKKSLVFLSGEQAQAWTPFMHHYERGLCYVSGMDEEISNDGGIEFTPTGVVVDMESGGVRYPLDPAYRRSFSKISQLDGMTDSEIQTLWDRQREVIASKLHTQRYQNK